MNKKDLDTWAKNEAKKYNRPLSKVKKELGLQTNDLIAMSAVTDPFYMTQGKILKAQWAREITETVLLPYLRTNHLSNTHLRDLHYILLSRTTYLQDGSIYENTAKCWGELIQSFSIARYLEYIPWEIIRDEKNKLDDRIYFDERQTLDNAIERAKDNIDMDKIINDAFITPFNYLLNPWKYQPVLIEIWTEKSLALLDNIISKYNINCVTGEGETSVTMVYKLIERIKESNRPCRIAYLSDCDVVGYQMVKSMSRKLEYLLQLNEMDNDVKVIPLLLTATQVSDLHLPTKPMKESNSKAYETRKELFYQSRGLDGAVEINALTAQQPQFFINTVEDFITSFIDVSLWNDVMNYRREIPSMIADLLQRERLDEDMIKRMISGVIEGIDWDALRTKHNDKIDSFVDRGDAYDYIDEDNSRIWLFDTDRDYFDQLTEYSKYDSGDNL